MKRYLVILVASLLLSGCDHDLPKVDSGYVRHMDGGAFSKQELTFLQVAAFSEWCAQHRSGWKNEIADVPPEKMVTFRHQGTDVITASLVGSKLVVGRKSRLLTADEAKTLEEILSVKKG